MCMWRGVSGVCGVCGVCVMWCQVRSVDNYQRNILYTTLYSPAYVARSTFQLRHPMPKISQQAAKPSRVRNNVAANEHIR